MPAALAAWTAKTDLPTSGHAVHEVDGGAAGAGAEAAAISFLQRVPLLPVKRGSAAGSCAGVMAPGTRAVTDSVGALPDSTSPKALDPAMRLP